MLKKIKLNSPFDMERPYDLLAFLNQEKRWDAIFENYNDLMKHQKVIDALWFDVGEHTNSGTQILQDKDCEKAGNINAIDWHASILDDGSEKVPQEKYLFPSAYHGPSTDVPDCKRISSLTFSMFAFEHLESMMQRDNLSANPEYVLPELLTPIMTLDQFGHWVTGVLRENSSSWLHYHMASMFWRIRGNAPKALECSRRAVHYAPRAYKDIALGSLGVVLHRAGKSNDAIIVLSAAIDHDPTSFVNYFAIANAYSVIGEYNTSLKYYDDSLKLNPGMELLMRHKYGVMCQAKLSLRIKAIRETLNKLRDELNVYTQKQEAWTKLQTEFLKTIKNGEENNREKSFERMSEITGLNMKEFKDQIDKNSLIKYFLDGPLYSDERLGKQGISAIDTVSSLERLIRHVNKNLHIADNNLHILDQLIDGEIKESRTKSTDTNKDKSARKDKTESRPSNEKKSASDKTKLTDEELISQYETGIFMYPPTMQINRNTEDFDKESDWPSNRFCKEAGPAFPPRVEAVFPVFLPFENKGVRMKYLLTDKIGVPLAEEYELPWHPPTCPIDKEATAFMQKKSSKPQVVVNDVVQIGYLRQKLLEYVSDGNIGAAVHKQDAEIGQRIHVAMKKRLAPKWMIYTLASLYWRVRGNNVNAMHCLLSAGRRVQPAYGDIVLVSLASVYLETGQFDEALIAAEEAFKMSLYEPATNFILAELNMIKKHRNTHMFHLKQVVRVEPDFMNGLARNLLNAWSCILKQVSSLRHMDSEAGDLCTRVKQSGNMYCEKGGDNCHQSNIQCFSNVQRIAISRTLASLMEENDELTNKAVKTEIDEPDSPKKQAHNAINKAVAGFKYFADTSKEQINKLLAHQVNFDNTHLLKTVDVVLKGCAPKGCDSEDLTPVDLFLKVEDCEYHHVQIRYWMHIVGVQQLLDESKLELPSKIKTMSPSSKNVPECRPVADPVDDFYLERLGSLETDGWEPDVGLMQKFSEMFDKHDFIDLGGKIAKYVETWPQSWLGALAAGWWCGAGGSGACTKQCLSAAHEMAPAQYKHLPLRLLAALLYMHSNKEEAKDVAYLALYLEPKNKIESFLAAVTHTYLAEYDQAIWMFRFSLTYDKDFFPAKACLYATMCDMFFGEGKIKGR
ncbi:uncharacterized protein LOC112053846 isoform X2 [Bicyclus anynana]|uniref:Uncharacterized protein LOC112053846 isoform X2 n=1 Tax=Bicyclus anynana TaxID=110368 RepID=A0ABM3LGL2_BICAN|nr:uncharacterized protein LOC112053846 isoform X2 [Bicyclus anynana]